MTPSKSSLLIAGRTAAVALAFGAALLVGAPAMAAGPSMHFGITIPGLDVYTSQHRPHFHDRSFYEDVCLGPDEVASELEDAGWDNVHIGRSMGNYHYLAFGDWYDVPYSMDVDRCSGNVGHVMPVAQPFIPVIGTTTIAGTTTTLMPASICRTPIPAWVSA